MGFILLFCLGLYSRVTWAQNITTCGSTGGVNMVGSMQGYSQPTNCSVNYRVLNYRKVSTTAVNPTDGRGQWKTTCNVQASGGDFAPSNMAGGGGGGGGFLLTNGDICGNTGQYTRKWVFPSVFQGTLNGITAVNYFTSGGSDMGLNMSTAGRYTVVLQDVGCANSFYYIGYTLNAPVTLAFGAQVLNGDGSYTVPITTSATPSAGENIFIRYRITTNDFTSSTFLVQATGAGTAWSATLPIQATGTVVYYYAFTSTRTLANLNADTESNRSLSTLNYLDNAGNNYSYTQTVSIGPILVTGTTPVTSAYYTSLTKAAGAFAAINAGTHKGVITVTIMSDVTTEDGVNPLYQSGYLGSSSYSAITISPSGARTISGSVNTQMIDLNGADNVTINGLNTGGNSLIIENTSAAASNGTLRLVNDASTNTITNCTLRGSSNQTNAAVVFFSSADGTLLQGNDNNTISNCIIRESNSGDPIFGINSFGSAGGTPPAARWNSGNSILNNQIINVYSPTLAICASIQLTNGANTSWTITGNSIYWTNSKTSTAATVDYYYGIRITGGNGQNFTISNNFIGGTAVNCGGTPMTISNGTYGNKISGMDLSVATTGTVSSVMGNTIANFNLNTNSSKTSAPYVFSGIVVEQGKVNIGTVATPNIIGSTSVNGSISVSVQTNAGGVVVGIGVGNAASTTDIRGNIVSGFTITNPASSTTYVDLYGIALLGGVSTVYQNEIGKSTLANSLLNSTGNTSSGGGAVLGIYHSATSSTFSQNTISRLTYNAGGTGFFVCGVYCSSGTVTQTQTTVQDLNSSSPQTIGIYMSSGATSIDNSVISNVYNSFASAGIGPSASVIGLLASATTSGVSISNCTVSNIQNTNVGAGAYNAIGIFLANGASSAHNINASKIYDVKVANTSTSATIDGVSVGSATNATNLINNMISLGSGLTNNPVINGVNLSTTGVVNLSYNSIVVTGAASGTAAFTRALRVGATGSGTSLLNNIFYNDRTSATPANNFALFFNSATQLSNVTTSNYNNLYQGTNTNLCAATGVAGTPYATLAAWRTNTSKDLNSLNVAPIFTNIINNLHLTSNNCSLFGSGTTIATTIDYDNETRKSPPDIGADENIGSGTVTWTGTISTDWNASGNWCPPVVPTALSNVTIPSAPVNQPLISNANAVCNDLTISAGAAHLDMSVSKTLTLSSGAVFTNNGAFNCGVASEEVIFAGSGTITGSASTTYRNLTINGTTTLLTVPTISANLKLNSTANVTASPNYGAASTLIYNNTGSYNVVTEWTGSAITAGTGVPNNVIIQNGTTLNMPAALRGMAGDLTISSGTLQMNGTSGADLNIGGNWTRVAATGVFNPNSRAVSFKGAANQTVTVVGGGIERFNILVIDKPNAGTYLLPSAVVGNLTDITVNGNMASNVAVLQFINQGSLDLNGRTFRVDGNNSSSYPGHIYVNGARTVYNSGGINNGSFAIMSSANPNQSTWYTRSVWNNFGTGTLTFNQDVLVTLADGRMDWGLDALGVNVTTIQGVLQINLGGSVVYNSCYYSSSPPSTLRFANTIDYQVNAGDKTWAFGAIYSGLPGIPWNVDVTNTNTDLTINEVRALRNNLTISDGRLTINAGPFNVGGNWTRTNPAGITVPPCAFIPNSNKVVFDKTGAGDQTITCTVNSNTETFYDLDISPATVNVAFGGATNVVVTNNLILTSGKVDMNGNMLTLGTTSASGTLTGGSATSYLLAFKAAMNGTFRRYTPSTGVSYLYPVGDNSNYTPMNITYNAGTTLSSAYTDGQLYAVAHPQKGTATSYINRYWPITPSGVTTPDYNAVYTYVDADVIGTEAILFPFKYNSYGWVGSGGSGAAFMQGSGSVNTVSNTLTWTNINSFSEFTALGNGSPLPINLVSFTGKLLEPDVHLNWTTVTEQNNDYFTLERSWDGIHFEIITKQKGAGNSNFTLNYFYTDKSVSTRGYDRVYYRLKQTDFNGAYTYSSSLVIALSASTNELDFSCFPNPFSDSFQLLVNAPSGESAQLEIYTSTGKLIFENHLEFTAAKTIIPIDALKGFSSGIYVIKLSCRNQLYTQKIIKE